MRSVDSKCHFVAWFYFIIIFIDIHVFTIVHACLGSLSCCNTQFLFKICHAFDSKQCCKISLNTDRFILPWICTKRPTPFVKNAPQTITCPSLCFIVGTWYLQLYLLPWCPRAYCLPSLSKRMNFDSSEKSTFGQLYSDQSLCNNTNSRRVV